MKIGLILRGNYRKTDIEIMKKHFDVVSFELPIELPEFIENPEDYLKIPKKFFDVDMIISYAAHPDINLEIIKLAEKNGIKLVIFSGGAKAGSYKQLKEEGKKRGVKVIWEEICCSTPAINDSRFDEFFSLFGVPEFEIEVKNGKIKDVKVKKSAFCGATYFVAEKIKGLSVNEAPAKAGYYTQIYPCMASRGINGGIHRAARVHKRAVEKALQKANKLNKHLNS
ncbi:MAG: hypothetical protein J7K36_06235 [Archaeoglobaceae archaeon]|nr:hypothetical protein [Archaeoglobaceae archaeon]